MADPRPSHMPRYLLYVEDDTAARRSVARHLRSRHAALHDTGTARGARALVRGRTRFCGFIVDYRLPDDDGLALIEDLRRRHPGVPAMLLTGELSRELVNECARRDIRYVVKPFGLEQLDPFFEAVFARLGQLDPADVEELIVRVRATEREAQILRRSLLDQEKYDAISDALGVSRHTVKTHVRNLLSKTPATSLAELRELLLTGDAMP